MPGDEKPIVRHRRANLLKELAHCHIIGPPGPLRGTNGDAASFSQPRPLFACRRSRVPSAPGQRSETEYQRTV
jgi:hypothetical protein